MKFKNFLLIILLFLSFPACSDDKLPENKNVKTLVFDFDGTLADTLSLTIQCINTLAADYGGKRIETKEDIDAFRESSIMKIMTDNLGWKVHLIPGLIAKAKGILKENSKEIKIFDGVKELLEILATKYELAIITSNTEETVKETLERYKISSIIKDIYCDSSIFGKDVVIKRFLESRHLAPNQMVYVGDEVRDIDACKKAGVKIICVTWGFNSKKILEKSNPDYLVDSYDELEKIVSLAFA